MEPMLCFVKESYFVRHSYYIKMLDTGNTRKQSRRSHLCVMVRQNENNFYIPLRNNLGAEIRKFGRIGHAVPSDKRGNAGLDYRYALVINDSSYIEPQIEKKIPRSQYQKIKMDYEIIQAEFAVYLNGFIKAAKKKRNEKEPLYKESSLINYLSELGL